MAEPSAPAPLDRDQVNAFAFQVWSYKQGEMVSLMIHLGDRLGLYRAMDGAGPLTPAELAQRAGGLAERWVQEWLRGQAAAKLVDYRGDDRFELTPTGAAVSPTRAAASRSPPAPSAAASRPRWSIGWPTRSAPASASPTTCRARTPRIAPSACSGPGRGSRWCPTILPALDGVVPKLERGAHVLDVGCGAGVAIFAMAKAFPKSVFDGYDLSHHAVARARETAARTGFSNVEFFERRGEEVPPDPVYDFVLTFDCLHDMTRPDRVTRAIRGAMKDDGTWLIKDIKCHAVFEKNMRNPMLAMMYGFSVSSCMSSALSEPDGMGLGTVGLNPDRLRAMTAEAGFTRFRQHDFEDPANLYYEVRP